MTHAWMINKVVLCYFVLALFIRIKSSQFDFVPTWYSAYYSTLSPINYIITQLICIDTVLMQSSAAATSNDFLKFFLSFSWKTSTLKEFRWLHLLSMTSVRTAVYLDRYGNANSPGLKTCLLDFVGMQEVRWIFEIFIVFWKTWPEAAKPV